MGKAKISFWKFTPEICLMLFLIGFGVGVLAANLLWEPYLQQGNVLGIYILFQLTKEELSGKEYFLYILKYRGGWILLCVLSSFSIWGAPLAVITLLLGGIFLGLLLALSILQFGVLGMASGVALFLPQGLCYLPVLVVLMGRLAQRSMGYWGKQGKISKTSKSSWIAMGTCLAGWLVGMLLETYVNPVFLNFILDRINIF